MPVGVSRGCDDDSSVYSDIPFVARSAWEGASSHTMSCSLFALLVTVRRPHTSNAVHDNWFSCGWVSRAIVCPPNPEPVKCVNVKFLQPSTAFWLEIECSSLKIHAGAEFHLNNSYCVIPLFQHHHVRPRHEKTNTQKKSRRLQLYI